MDRNIYRDGWHDAKEEGLSFYVENGRLKRGTIGEGVNCRTVYPYRYDKRQKCYVRVEPSARYSVLDTVSWK
jgi:hypothetical protein